MNFNLSQIPERKGKPRRSGITMVMDKGLSIEEAKNFLSIAHPYVDIVKLGFGTSFVTPQLREKIKAYQSYDLPVYFGGTLFEAFLIRNQFQDYVDTLKEYNISYMEVSDGSITIPHAEKCGYIEKLTRYGVVFSEVGRIDDEWMTFNNVGGKRFVGNNTLLCSTAHKCIRYSQLPQYIFNSLRRATGAKDQSAGMM